MVAADGMKVEIDLGQLGFLYGPDGEGEQGPGILGLIVEAAARKVLEGDREIKSKVVDTANQMIRERVAEMVQQAFDEPIQRTTLWGEEQGQPTTVRELIRLSLEDFLKSEGRRSSLDNYRKDGPAKNLRELIDGEVQSTMTTEMRNVINTAKADVVKTVTSKAADAIAEAIKK